MLYRNQNVYLKNIKSSNDWGCIFGVSRMNKDQPIIESILKLAAKRKAVIALPEAEDSRIIAAAVKIKKSGLAHPLLIPNPGNYKKAVEELKQQKVKYYDISFEEINREQIIAEDRIPLVGLEIKGKDYLVEQMIEQSNSPAKTRDFARNDNGLHISALLLSYGLVDGAVAGASNPSSEIILTALNIVGLAPKVNIISSCFLMLKEIRALTFADCAVVPQPSSSQLASIAFGAAAMHAMLCGEKAKVALLSFSTHGSSQHPSINLVKEAMEIIGERNPNFDYDGELQFDAAFDEQVAQRKAPRSDVAGKANVFIFPDLSSANIGYKIAERLGGFTALGPLLIGLKAPLMDLSRGAKVEDIVTISAISALMSMKNNDLPSKIKL